MIDRLKGLIRLRLMRNILALYGVRAVEQLLPLVLLALPRPHPWR